MTYFYEDKISHRIIEICINEEKLGEIMACNLSYNRSNLATLGDCAIIASAYEENGEQS